MISRWPHARTWYTVGVLMTLVVVVVSLVPARELPDINVSDKYEHFTAFAALTLWFGGLVEPRRYPILALLLLALGGAIEVAQGLMGLGRQADVRDLYADGAGIVTGVLLGLAGLRHWVRWTERWLSRA